LFASIVGRECLIKTSFVIRSSRSNQRARIETSSTETASSDTNSSGSITNALAVQMRWDWPPENSCGSRPIPIDPIGFGPFRTGDIPAITGSDQLVFCHVKSYEQ
jgi:hypothetical protein